MKHTIETRNEHTIVFLDGRLDTTQADGFEKAMTELLEGGHKKIVFDCDKLHYISSSGLRIFLIMQKKMMGSGGKFTVCSLQAAIKEIFDMSGFTMIFDIQPDLDAALAKG